MRSKILLAALAATAVFASPAAAQTTASEQAEVRGTVLLPLTLTENTNLDFGTVLASAVAGQVSINSDTGVRSVGGGVTGVAIDAGHRATFTGFGTPGTQVNVSLTSPAFLISGANVIAVNAMSLDSGGATRTINAAGTFEVGVGGTFDIAANQPNGVYTATFTVTAQYP